MYGPVIIGSIEISQSKSRPEFQVTLRQIWFQKRPQTETTHAPPRNGTVKGKIPSVPKTRIPDIAIFVDRITRRPLVQHTPVPIHQDTPTSAVIKILTQFDSSLANLTAMSGGCRVKAQA